MARPLHRPVSRVRLDVSLAIVNIVLLLIFFFLATGRLLNPVGPGLALPETVDLPLDQLPSPILVIGTEGDWSLNGTSLAPELLDVALQELPPPVTLHLLIHKDASANTLIGLMNRPELSDIELRLVTTRNRALATALRP